MGAFTDPAVFPPEGEFGYRFSYGAFATVGALIVIHRPSNTVGRILCAIGLTSAIASLGQAYSWYALVHQHGSLPGGMAAGWLGSWLFVPAFGLFWFLLLLFPDGRLPSPRWRPVAWLAAAHIALTCIWVAFEPQPLDSPPYLQNPLGIGQAADALQLLGRILVPTVGLLLALSTASVVMRFRRSQGPARQQLKWFVYGAVLALVEWAAYHYVFREAGSGNLQPEPVLVAVLDSLAAATPAVAIGVAILKYRLYDIDRLISRSLVYAGLTAAVVGVYVAAVELLGAVFPHRGLGVSLGATGLIAVGFQPARERLQRTVDRLLYGHRHDPYTVLSQLGQRIEATLAPEAILPSVVNTVASALKLPYVVVELSNGDRVEATSASNRPLAELTRLPLSYQGELAGELVVASRSPGERLTPADQLLLADIARHAGVAVHAVQLTAELQRSRVRLVSAREEERRRLRRDLHDGLGPTLAGVVLQLGAAKALVDQDRLEACRLLGRLRAEVQQAIIDIRRLVYQLRPPALDELGLVGALRAYASHLQYPDSNELGSPSSLDHLTVTVDGPAQLPPLPAAVEVAAYRIATEALANTARHASASRCTVRLAVDNALELEVADDGRGLPTHYRPGVGLISMRERAAELGGSCTVRAASGGGTRISARLPIPSGGMIQ
jgi:signal transduction histidine kinase